MTANMGTPGNPEGLSHWTAKALLSHRLRRGIQNKGRGYGTPFKRQLRNISIPSGLDTLPQGLQTALEQVQERVDKLSPLALTVSEEPPHNDCAGGVVVTNLLDGMRGGDVKLEEPFDNYIPDIALYREGASAPHIVVEVVNTSSSSERKRRFYEGQGIVAFELHTQYVNLHSQALQHATPMYLWPLANLPCGETQRKEVTAIDKYVIGKFKSGEEPFVGIKAYPSGTQGYIFGTYDADADQRWSFGEPEVLAICPTEVAWDSPPMVKPMESRSISKSTFLVYVATVIERMKYFLRDERASTQEKAHYLNLMNYAHDLLAAVNIPD